MTESLEGNSEQGLSPELFTGPTISVWRAITGSHFSREKTDFNTGIANPQLAGAFASNGSIAQNSGGEFEWFTFEEFSPMRYVPGLPVFAERRLAEQWLRNHRYDPNPPVLAELRLPLSVFYGEHRFLTLIQNTVRPNEEDHLVTLAELQAHITNQRLIQGECFLSTSNKGPINEKLVRNWEILYRPNTMKNGQIDQNAEFIAII